MLFRSWLIKASPNPHIDVYTFHQEAYRALSQHVNPYAITMPNIYGHTMWYADGYATGGRVLVGFLYPPLSLLLAWPAHLLGDYRYAMALAVTLSGAFLAYARPGRLGSTVAAVFLFTPRGLLVIEQGWTESLVVLCQPFTIKRSCVVERSCVTNPLWLGEPLTFGIELLLRRLVRRRAARAIPFKRGSS